MTSKPAIDVIIPVYNGGKTVEKSIRSICSQTLKNIRIIVVDDGSTDNTASTLRHLASQDDRIRVITTENNGIVDALNTGVTAADADIIARFDADDIAFEDRLAVQYKFLEENPECAGVGCNVYFTDDDGCRTGKKSNFPFNVPFDPLYAPAREPYLLHPFLLVRRRALQAVMPYRYAFHSEDADLYWRLSTQGSLVNLPDVLGEYRVHSASVSSQSALNGRISAVNSQLAALSESRRRAGFPDIAFSKSMLQNYVQANSLERIIKIAAQDLTEKETAHLSIATTAKLLELSSYRPYRLEKADFATMRSILQSTYYILSRQNRLRVVLRQIILPNGPRPFNEILALMPWSVLARVLVDLLAYSGEFIWMKLNRKDVGA